MYKIKTMIVIKSKVNGQKYMSVVKRGILLLYYKPLFSFLIT